MGNNQVFQILAKELERQRRGLEMIPSENFVSEDVLRALGSIGTNKYSEGYPGKRYYGGCENIDDLENLAIKTAKEIFHSTHANVQPYSGSPANQAALISVLEPGDKIMGLDVKFGGHLTHGLKVNFSGKFFQSTSYQTDINGYLDYDAILAQAKNEKPKMIICGATAYSRIIDFQKFAEIAKAVDAWLLADISHIAGLVAAGLHPTPIGLADIVTTTTHKTLRGPRGAMILCNGNVSEPLKKPEVTRENLPSLVDRAVFPGLQGGPHNHSIAALAVALAEVKTPEFKSYAQNVITNAKVLADELMSQGLKVVTGGTDNHLLLVDVSSQNITGKLAVDALARVGITCNKNLVPFDTHSPADPSGIRLGSPALTTRGFTADDFKIIANIISETVKQPEDKELLKKNQQLVTEMCNQHPLYPNLTY